MRKTPFQVKEVLQEGDCPAGNFCQTADSDVNCFLTQRHREEEERKKKVFGLALYSLSNSFQFFKWHLHQPVRPGMTLI